jgi:hypothetical protein
MAKPSPTTRQEIADTIRHVLEIEHGPLVLQSHCGLAVELDSQPV